MLFSYLILGYDLDILIWIGLWVENFGGRRNDVYYVKFI